MITDMKRIGNQVENIVELATNLNSTYAENYLSIGRMAESTIRMVKLSIQAFVNKDLEMAKEAKLYDDIIDEFFCLIKNDLISIIHQNPDSGEYAIDVLMIIINNYYYFVKGFLFGVEQSLRAVYLCIIIKSFLFSQFCDKILN